MKLVSLISAGLLTSWSILAYSFYTIPGKGRGGMMRPCVKNYWSSRIDRVQIEAAQAGVPWNARHTIQLWCGSILSAGFLFLVTRNGWLFLISGVLTGALPGMLIQMKYRQQRIELLECLVVALRQIIARIPDQGGLIKAIESTLQCGTDPKMDPMLREMVQEIGLGISVPEALVHWKQRIGMRKFDKMAGTLLQAHSKGWSPAAMQSLNKALQAMEADLQAIRLVRQKSRQYKRQLYFMVLTAWSFPFILSLLRVGDANIYRDSPAGRLLVFAYAAGSLVTIAKGGEYLSLNADEL